MKSLYRPTAKKGVWESRFCSEWVSKESVECIVYETYIINTNLKHNWELINATDYVMIPMEEL